MIHLFFTGNSLKDSCRYVYIVVESFETLGTYTNSKYGHGIA